MSLFGWLGGDTNKQGVPKAKETKGATGGGLWSSVTSLFEGGNKLPQLKLDAADKLPPEPKPTGKDAAGLGQKAGGKVDAKANPMHKPEQHCGNCVQFKGAATDAVAPCQIFAGKSVVNKGWCKVWAKKPGA